MAKLSDFSYPDARDALTILSGLLAERQGQIEESETFADATRNALLRDVNYLIIRVTAFAGMIIRSASVRNAFELYVPFLAVCKQTVGDSARLILSSEWEYIPFTLPQSIEELPEFIVIGIPASESDNVLVFPTAGHELGHSIWSKHSLEGSFSNKLESLIDEALNEQRAAFDHAFPEAKGADLDEDMFVQHIKSTVFSAAILQSEELFSDFVGISLFGVGYLFAFKYLVAPQVGGTRVHHYPDTSVRAAILQRYARSALDVELNDYASSFMKDDPFSLPQDTFVCSVADQAVSGLLDDLFAAAAGRTSAPTIRKPSKETTQRVKRTFESGAPFDDDASIGDLINAAWEIFLEGDPESYKKQGRAPSDFISDLVLKSAEIAEIRTILR